MLLCSQGSSIREIDGQSGEALMLFFGRSRAEFGVLRMIIIIIISVVDGAPVSFLHYVFLNTVE